MVPYRILLENTRTQQVEVVTGEIPLDLWNTLLAFHNEAVHLAKSEWIVNGMPGTYSIEYDGSGIHVERMEQPPRSHVAEVIHGLRPFVLQSEALYYPRISGNLFKILPHDYLKRVFARHRAMFSGDVMREAFVITKNDMEINSESSFDLWIDAFEYHRHGTDTKRRERFLARYGGPPDDLSLAVFQDMLKGKIQAVLNLSSFVEQIERSPTYQAHIRSSATIVQ